MTLAVSTLAPVSLLHDSFLKNTDERNLSTNVSEAHSLFFRVSACIGENTQLGAKMSLTLKTLLFNRKVLAIAAQCKAPSNQRGM